MQTAQLKTLLANLCRKRVPGQLVIQITDRCNAFCPQCGMRVTEKFARSRLSVDDVKRILDCAAERGVTVVSFTGGEPFLLLEELTELIRYAGRAGIEYIRTGTNGFIFIEKGHSQFESRVKRIAESLAGTPLRNLWISIDSAVPEVHEKMRGFPGVIKGIEKALPLFHEVGIYPSANLGISRNMGGESRPESEFREIDRERRYREFSRAFRTFYDFVVNLGFTMVNVCYPMSLDDAEIDSGLSPVYAATSTEPLVKFSKDEKTAVFKALLDTVPEFRSRIRVFSPRSSIYALSRYYENGTPSVHPCRGGEDFFFIDSKDGNTYPCGYRGLENLGKYWEPGWHSSQNKTPCHRCDWECFRDPSELFGPLLHAFSHPLTLAARVRKDPTFYRLWFEDLKYYQACDLFSGRRPPNSRKLRAFGKERCDIPLMPASPLPEGEASCSVPRVVCHLDPFDMAQGKLRERS